MVSLLKLNKVSFSPNKSLTIARDISLDICLGDFIVIVGSNGSGKSTLIKLINRTYSHTQGEILLEDKPIENYGKELLSQSVVTLSQFVRDSLFTNLTVQENALLLAMSYPCQKNKSLSKKVFNDELKSYLHEFNVKLSMSLKTPLYLLSGGEQQILAFALYLRHQPKLLLLDEHTSALDPKTSDKIMQFTHKVIVERKITCLMTTHSLDFALNYGNRLIAVKEGSIIFEADAAKKSSLQKTQLLEYCY